MDLLALEAINSPFLLDGADAELKDLLICVWILSSPHARDCTVSNLEPSAEWIKEATASVDMVRDCSAVAAYMRDYYSLPEVMRTIADRPVTPLGCPWMLSTVVTITRSLHIPLYEAWTMGIGQLLWYRASLEELESEDSRVVDTSMRSKLEAAKQSFNLMERLPSESDAEFAARTGLSINEVTFFSSKNGGL